MRAMHEHGFMKDSVVNDSDLQPSRSEGPRGASSGTLERDCLTLGVEGSPSLQFEE